MDPDPTPLHAPLGFTRAEDVQPDPEHPGLRRARSRPLGGNPAEIFDFRSCALHDLTHPEVAEPGFEEAGFETIDLSALGALQQALAAIRREDRLSDESAAAIRTALDGASFALGSGRRLRVEHVADDGMIHRRAGPNGRDVNPGGMDGANGHGGAPAIHGDQDVFGTPLRQMMNGNAPQLFRHRTHDARNDAALCLLNLWIPLQQITRPLVLMDRRSLDATRDQLRYGLPVTSFLERDEAQHVNDIWTFLPDPAQKWHFRSEMSHDQGYIFDTLGEPHGACILPGEEALDALAQALERALEASDAGDEPGAQRVASEPRPALPAETTGAIRHAAARMTALLDEATAGGTSDRWRADAGDAADATIRRSLEMRLVATLQDA